MRAIFNIFGSLIKAIVTETVGQVAAAIIITFLVGKAILTPDSTPLLSKPTLTPTATNTATPLPAPTSTLPATPLPDGLVILSIVNETSSTISKVYASPVGETNWGDNRIDSAIPVDGVYEILLRSGRYDLRSEDMEGNKWEVGDVDISSSNEWKLRD